MKYCNPLTLSLAVVSILAPSANARIGESRSSFESRLFNNGGIILRDKEERSTRQQTGPYTTYLDYLGASAEVRLYFKSDDGRQPTQTDVDKNTLGTGWEVHVLYVNGKSVLELYKRVGSITEPETNALLALLGGGGYWEKAGKAETLKTTEGSEDEPPPSAFGFDFVRNDGKVRAKKTGGGLMVFQKQLDEYLAKQHESRLLQSAPKSVQGF